jgi:beta-glucosidase
VARAGREVVQVYVRHPDAGRGRPDRELKGFAVVTLDAAMNERVEIALPRSAFARWSDDGWTVLPGDYDVLVGASSDDIRCSLPAALK